MTLKAFWCWGLDGPQVIQVPTAWAFDGEHQVGAFTEFSPAGGAADFVQFH